MATPAYSSKTEFNDGAAQTTHSFSHTVPALSNGALVVGLTRSGGVTTTGVTYGGVALTQLAIQDFDGARVRAELWLLVAPVAGTATLTVTSSGNSRVAVVAGNYEFVDPATPTGTTATTYDDTSTNAAPLLNVTSAAGEVVIALLGLNNATTTVASGTGVTDRGAALQSGTSPSAAVLADAAGATTTTAAWTLSPAPRFGIVAVPLKPAADDGGGEPVAVTRGQIVTMAG
jgi:hypothetical protein